MANFASKNKGGTKKIVAAGSLPIPVSGAEISHGRCKVCKSPWRREIDSLLATGWSQAAVVRHFNDLMSASDGFEQSDLFNAQNMSTHAKKHLTSRDAAVRKIYEERARAMGVDIEAAENFIITRAAVLDTIIHQGLAGIHSGDTQVEAKEIISAIQMLDKMEAEWKDTAIDELMSEFKLFMEAVKEVVGEDMYADIYERFEAKVEGRDVPVLKAIPAEVIEAKAEHVIEENEVVEVDD